MHLHRHLSHAILLRDLVTAPNIDIRSTNYAILTLFTNHVSLGVGGSVFHSFEHSLIIFTGQIINFYEDVDQYV